MMLLREIRNVRSLKYPLKLFDRITVRNMICPNSHPTLLSRSRGESTIEYLKSMLGHGVMPDHVTLSCSIRAISDMHSDDLKGGIHTVAVKTGFDSEISIVTALIGLYSSQCKIESAWQLFYQTPMKDLILWTAMVSAFCKNGQFTEAIVTFREMQYSGVSPNTVSLLNVLPACANTGDLLHGKQVHGFSIRREFLSETNLQNSFVGMYAKCGKLHSSIAVFNGIREKDIISWKSIICGCTENGQPRKALLLFSRMRSSDTEPDAITVQHVIGVCLQVGELLFGLGLHCFVIKDGLSDSTSIGTTLLRMYADFREVETARSLFNQLHYKDLIAWTAMISAYVQTGYPGLALETFKQMQLAKEEANEITMVSLLQACSSMDAQELGRSIHAHATRLGYTSNMFIVSVLIDFYCKIGRLWQGKALFDRLQSKDLVCWSSIINGYGINGYGEEAIQTFSNMLEQEMMPNEVIFVSILSACSHCGLVDEGWKWFYSMEKYGISPTLAHYTCIVDMLSRQGRVEESLEFVYGMPMEPDVSVWGALLSGCRETNGNIKVAEIAAGQLIRLDPSNTSYYVALSNIYSELGQWDDAKRSRELIEEKGFRKKAGNSMV